MSNSFFENKRINKKLILVFPALLMIFPIIAYFGFIKDFGVNILEGDDWSTLKLIRNMYSGTLTFSELLASYNGHRMLVPNILFILDAKFFHYNTKLLMYGGWVLLTIAFFSLFYIFHVKNKLTIWVMVPVSFLMFTFSQYEDTLFGFQIAWYIILACLAVMFLLLEQRGSSPYWFGLSISLAIIASFSSFQGLLLWPAGFIYVIFNGYNVKQKILWVLFSIITIVIYFSGQGNLIESHNSLVFPVVHPIESVEFFFVALGSIIPVSSFPLRLELNAIYMILFFIGLIFFLSGLFPLIMGISLVKKNRKYIAPLALIVFVFLYEASLILGRGMIGLSAATSSHYTIYTILFLVSTYTLSAMIYSQENKNKKILILQFFIVNFQNSYG